MNQPEPNKQRELAILTIHNQWIIGFYVGADIFLVTTHYVLRDDGKFEELTMHMHRSVVERWVELDSLFAGSGEPAASVRLGGSYPPSKGGGGGGYDLTVTVKK